MSRFLSGSLLCIQAMPVIMLEPVKSSEPEIKIMTIPLGKIKPLIILIRPGAFSWNHGAAVAMTAEAEVKLTRQPAMKAEKKILSGRALPLMAPIRDINSAVSFGVYAAMLAMLSTWTCVTVISSVGSDAVTPVWVVLMDWLDVQTVKGMMTGRGEGLSIQVEVTGQLKRVDRGAEVFGRRR